MTIETHPSEKSERSLIIAIAITVAMLIIEVVGYFISNSLALLSDAAHVLLHVLTLGITLWAIRLACKPPCETSTFGHHRAEPLVALFNAVTLIILAFVIFFEAYQRSVSPPSVKGFEMLSIAVVGLVGNVAVLLILRGPKDLTLRSAYLHIIGDTLSSVAVVVGGIAITLTGIFIIDPILSFLIGGIIIVSTLQLAKESIDILMERTPAHIKPERLKSKILEIDGVCDIHDVHVWSLCSHIHAMSAHITVDEVNVERTHKLVDRINHVLREEFEICHTTLQIENRSCEEVTRQIDK
jgi:cobalt-zinc-cadmium efflux system protein